MIVAKKAFLRLIKLYGHVGHETTIKMKARHVICTPRQLSAHIVHQLEKRQLDEYKNYVLEWMNDTFIQAIHQQDGTIEWVSYWYLHI